LFEEIGEARFMEMVWDAMGIYSQEKWPIVYVKVEFVKIIKY
jgi:hypothetical protein